MDTMQKLSTVRDLISFFEVFPYDLLPHSVAKSCTIIINADPQKEGGSHWLAIRLTPRSSRAFYFDSYCILPFVPSIQPFIGHDYMTWDYNRLQAQGPTTDVCVMDFCQFALY